MKKNDVKVGQTYRVKVSGSVADVRITGENPHGGWDGVNVLTKRKVRIKSAQRLRGKSPARPGGKRIMTKAEYEADAKREADVAKTVKAVEKGDLAKGVTVPTGAKRTTKASKDAKSPAKRHTGERAANGAKQGAKPMSLLDAAAHLLSLGTGDPMRCKDIVDLAVKRNLWTSGKGKTPASTLYAAIHREIKAKGDASRFVKAERGKFALTSRKGA